jgi:hypothetical protein
MRHFCDIYARVQQQLHLPTMKGVWFESSEANETEQTKVYSQTKMDRVKIMRIQPTQSFYSSTTHRLPIDSDWLLSVAGYSLSLPRRFLVAIQLEKEIDTIR